MGRKAWQSHFETQPWYPPPPNRRHHHHHHDHPPPTSTKGHQWLERSSLSQSCWYSPTHWSTRSNSQQQKTPNKVHILKHLQRNAAVLALAPTPTATRAEVTTAAVVTL